ncbi:hypothetical protein AGR1A_pAt20296 [Agrobacterium fabacearum CFBP 5771]|nr:hypothetical protein AGR1A_pAt20296 [Agrobacterium fabacearum CFBP 5771]
MKTQEFARIGIQELALRCTIRNMGRVAEGLILLIERQ